MSTFLLNLKQFKNIHVVGAAGTEGAAILAWLTREGRSDVTAHDFVTEDQFEEEFRLWHSALDSSAQDEYLLKIRSCVRRFCFGDNYLKAIDKADLIFVPQAWYKYHKNQPLQRLARFGRIFYTMTQLYLELNPGLSIGVTGSNGKTTVSNLIQHLLGVFPEYKVHLVGNDRCSAQLLHEIADWPKKSILVMEISNRQLKMPLAPAPDIAVITNVNPNHLDEHESFEDYTAVKALIIGKNTKLAILNYDNVATREIGKKILSKKGVSVLFFSTEQKTGVDIFVKNGTVFGGKLPLANIKNFSLPGRHNRANLLAALGATLAAAKLCRLEWNAQKINVNLKSCQAVSKRLELVRKIGGVEYFDDTASTSAVATLAAIKAFAKPITLIMGGNHKNVEYDETACEIKRKGVRLIMLPGTVMGKVKEGIRYLVLGTRNKKREGMQEGEEKEWKDKGVKAYDTRQNELELGVFSERNSLQEALELAKEITPKGGVVLVSPGGEHFYTMFLKDKPSIAQILADFGRASSFVSLG